MDRAISILMLGFSIILTVLSVFMTHYFIGFRKSNRVSTTAYLESAKTSKKVFIGHPFSGRWHKHWTLCVYAYHVKGKSYTINAGRPGTKTDIPKKVEVIFQKNTPQNAYIPEFTSAPSLWGLLFILLGCILFYVLSFYLWFSL